MKKRAKKAKSVKRARRALRSARRGERAGIAKAAVDLFVRGVLVRGEAAKAVKGRLPPGVTHEVVGKDDQGLPIIKRRRFSLA